MGCSSLRCLLSFPGSSNITQGPHSLKDEDSESPGARFCASIHPPSHSFIQDLLTAGDKQINQVLSCLEAFTVYGDRLNKI